MQTQPQFKTGFTDLESPKGLSIKEVGIFLAIFDTPLPHVGILTLIYLTSTF